MQETGMTSREFEVGSKDEIRQRRYDARTNRTQNTGYKKTEGRIQENKNEVKGRDKRLLTQRHKDPRTQRLNDARTQ
jgi:hypothetical protein